MKMSFKSYIFLFLFFVYIVIEGRDKNYLLLYFNTDSYFFNNSDFNSYDHYLYSKYKSDQLRNTDDALFFIYSNIGLRFFNSFDKTSFYTDFYLSGFWGNDNLETNNKNNVMVKELYFDLNVDNFFVRFGRQRFTLGGSIKDYIFYDIIDGILIEYSRGIFKIRFLFDILGVANKSEGYLFSSIEKDDEYLEDFQGKKVCYRAGTILEFDFIKTFFYYVYYGASKSGGADVSENGLNTVNEPDNDFLLFSGLRFYFEYADFTFVYSYGKDYRIENDLTYNGWGIILNVSKKIDIFTTYFGAGYFQNGFCGMKGFSPGEELLYGYKGYFAYPYVGSYHFVDYSKYNIPTYVDVTNTKAFIKFKNRLEYGGNFEIINTFFFDTKVKRYMGVENIIGINYKIENISLNFFGGIYFPYREYYNIIGSSFIPIGDDPFYLLGFKVSYLLYF